MTLSRGAVSAIVVGIDYCDDWGVPDCTVRLLGQGTFGKVVEAIDTQTNARVAIKIIRAIPKYRDASKIEVRVLQKLKERESTVSTIIVTYYSLHLWVFCSKCIHLLHWFDHCNHICLVSELSGMCVYDFLKENEFAPFPRQHIQLFARQLLGSVACKFLESQSQLISRSVLVLHDLHLIHTDLKPENIILVRNNYRKIAVSVPGKVFFFLSDACPPQILGIQVKYGCGWE
jgi:dual-specificity kinase